MTGRQDIWYVTPVEDSFDFYRDCDPQVENHSSRLLGCEWGWLQGANANNWSNKQRGPFIDSHNDNSLRMWVQAGAIRVTREMSLGLPLTWLLLPPDFSSPYESSHAWCMEWDNELWETLQNIAFLGHLITAVKCSETFAGISSPGLRMTGQLLTQSCGNCSDRRRNKGIIGLSLQDFPRKWHQVKRFWFIGRSMHIWG